MNIKFRLFSPLALSHLSRYVLPMINTVFLTSAFFRPGSEELARLNKAYPMINLTTTPLNGYDPAIVEDAEIVVGNIRAEDIKKAKKLKWLQTQSAGVDMYANRALFASPDILVTSASGTYGRQIGDHVLGMIIGFNHNFFTYRDQMKSRLWKGYYPPKDLWDSTLLVLGLGDLGSNIAKKAKALGLNIIAVTRSSKNKPEYVDELYPIEELDYHLGRADYFVLASAATPQTRNILNRERIYALKEGAVVINVSRGTLIDEAALTEALKSGHLGGAGLDVTAVEPLDPSSELWALDNVFITPHTSGLSPNTYTHVFDLFFENLGSYLSDKSQMKNLVNFDAGY